MVRRAVRMNVIEKQDDVKALVKNYMKDTKSIVYGARSINAQSKGIMTRPTDDWDAFNPNPKATANKLQRKLDKLVGGNYYYHKEAMHKGTWKVKGAGQDLKQNTADDESIADFSKADKKTPFVTINGIRYRVLKQEIRAKQKSVADPEFKFRHEKDRTDLNRIKGNIKISKLMGWKNGS